MVVMATVTVEETKESNIGPVVLGGLVVIVLDTGPKVCGFKPGRERWIFKGDKNP
jgi:hypothetical protein